MNTRPLPFAPSFLAVLAGVFLVAFTARAQGPDDLPAPAEPPPPPPTMDLTQMPLDVTPAPLDPRAQQQPQAQSSPGQPAATAPPAPTQRTPPPPPAATPPSNRPQRRPNAANNGSPTPAPAPNVSAPAAAPTPAVTFAPGGNLRLNFQNASLIDVLNYLSAAAGFIITQETPVTGTVNVVSQQPVTADEAVDLLSSLLTEKGYAVVRNGRILKIVALQDAPKRGDVPVYVGQEPRDIPRKDNMVTQIIPVRYAEVGKLVDNLRPLLSNSATISSNDSSNAIIITDTQTNIHRLAEIIHALDTSISGISQIRVFTLRFSDSKGLADVLTQLFSPQQRNNNNNNGNNPFGGVPPQFQRFLQQQQAAVANASPQSEARQAASRVVAVADETSNSVIVAAPEEVMSTVADVIAQLDTSTSDITETQIFRLMHADATELAAELTNLYADTGATPAGNNNNRGGNNNNRGPQPQNNNANRSERALLQARVVIVADARTNSVLVSASHDTMAQVGLTIGRLDSNKARKQRVFVYTLNHADPDNMATILRGMYSTTNGSSGNSATQPSASALANRTLNGASSDVTSSLNTNSSSSRTNGR